MKATRGQADAARVKELILEKLGVRAELAEQHLRGASGFSDAPLRLYAPPAHLPAPPGPLPRDAAGVPRPVRSPGTGPGPRAQLHSPGPCSP